MSGRGQNLEEVFLLATAMPTSERTRFLDVQCADNPDLRREIDSLLLAHDRADNFLDTPAPVRLDLLASADPEHPEAIGHYQIVRPLGTGGMGVVYLAEGGRPHRRVALKVLRSGLATASMRRRFELEAEALARLQHPAIAQVYEAGAARVGAIDQPYFAMELVEGASLTDYARDHSLGTRARLALVAEVCDAVQHAHQRGVVHRDLKPGNILVTPDGRPKVLDFGVSRVADPAASGAHTATGQLIGTLAYMSPEQVVGDVGAVDARTDVYALGVILYELLAGRVPLQVSDRAITDAARAIREDEPESLATIDRSLRGDVETIVRKSMDKDPARRYQSASELAADIRRFLNEEPIVARPPSTLYQLRKFAKRNKMLVAGLGAIFVVLSGGVVGTSIGLARAIEQGQKARDAAEAAELSATRANRTRDFLQSILTGADNPNQGSGAGLDMTVREVVRRAAVRAESELRDAPEVAAEVHRTIGETLALLGDFEGAQRELDLALAAAERAHPAPSTQVSSVFNAMAWMAILRGDGATGEELIRRAMDVPEAVLATDPEGRAAMMNMLGLAVDAQGRYAEAAEIWRESLEFADAHLGRESGERLSAMNNIADFVAMEGNLDEAVKILNEVREIRLRTLGETNPDYLTSLSNLAVYEARRYNFTESKLLYDELLDAFTHLYGPDHPRVGQLMNNYGTLLRRMNDHARAERAYRESLRIFRAGDGHDRLPSTLQNLASLRHELGDLEEADRLFTEALAIAERAGSINDQATILGNLAALRVDQGRWTDAEGVFLRARGLREQALGHTALSTFYATQAHGSMLRRLGRYDEALPELQRSAEGIRAAFGEENPQVMQADASYAWCLALAGRADEAEPILARAVESMRAWEGVNAVQLSFVEMAYGECLTILGRLEEADGVLHAAVDRRAQTQGADHPSMLDAELLVARLRAAQGLHEAARASAQRVLDVRLARMGECEAANEAREFLLTIPAE